MTSVDVPISRLSEVEHRTHLRRAMIASTVGTTIEWYDFLLYGQVTALVFGKLFFPKSDPLVGVLEAFAIFFIGFVGRPIGAAIFGHWGDRIGRKATLIVTLLVTGLATAAVGLVPTYASIGIWGAILLTVIRLIQEIGVGGEWGVRCSWRWNGRKPTRIGGSSHPGRNSERRPASSWQVWQCCFSAGFPATSFSCGAGASRS